MKSYRETATFPELPAAHAVQEARGEGSSLSVCIKRALDAICVNLTLRAAESRW
jgi:hypothetical protein